MKKSATILSGVLLAVLAHSGCGDTTPGPSTQDASLASLVLSAGILSPSFSSSVESYRVDLPFGTESVTVTPTATDPSALVTVAQDGAVPTVVPSGTASPPLTAPEPDASSVVTVAATVGDGSISRVYKMLWRVEPRPSSAASLSSLTLSAGVLRPVFATDAMEYSVTVPDGAAAFTVTPTATDAGARITVVQDGGSAEIVASGTASSNLTIPAFGASSTVAIIVVAADGATSRTYHVVLATGSATTGTPDPADLPDGWAGFTAPASPGGYGATADHEYTVRNRSGLVNALNLGGTSPSATPKIIYVDGAIDLSVDDADNPLTGWDYLDEAGYGSAYPTYEAFCDAYAAGCTAAGPDTTLETVRAAAHARQKAAVVIKIGSNTSILGVGSTAAIENGQLSLKGVDNVVIRNVAVLDAYDYFPAWDAGELRFNSSLDNIHVEGSTHIWVDHCELSDGARPDSTLPTYTIEGAVKKWVVHDGVLDITNQANYVTVSYNYVHDHDKTHLVGSSDSRTTDSGYLKTTFHHNYYLAARQRLPRVRFGQVHVYNNHFEDVGSYAIGIGVASRIYSEANVFERVARPVTTAFSNDSDPGYCYDSGSVGISGTNATVEQVGWLPSSVYPYSASSAEEARAAVLTNAGVGMF
jgi:pectate lyase